MIKKGDQVRILPGHQDPGDEEFVWVALDDEEKGRIDIQPINMQLNIKPIYTVRCDQVEVVRDGTLTDSKVHP